MSRLLFTSPRRQTQEIWVGVKHSHRFCLNDRVRTVGCDVGRCILIYTVESNCIAFEFTHLITFDLHGKPGGRNATLVFRGEPVVVCTKGKGESGNGNHWMKLFLDPTVVDGKKLYHWLSLLSSCLHQIFFTFFSVGSSQRGRVKKITHIYLLLEYNLQACDITIYHTSNITPCVLQ